MPSLTHQLLASRLRAGALTPGSAITLDVDQVLIEDATGSMTALQYEQLGAGRVAVDPTVLYVDHNVLALDAKDMDEHRYLQAFAARHGVHFSRPGNGISHYVHLERFARPGGVLVGADSHSTMAGAVGMVAVGAGGLLVAAAMAGHGIELACPRLVNVELRGRLPEWVQAKDVILELLRRHGVRGGVGAAFEFTGEGVATLSVTDRGTICNMITELGATAAVFPSDHRTRQWLAAQEREADFVELAADADAAWDAHEVIELDQLEPLIARPHSPGNVVPVAEIAGLAAVQVCVGSSVNSSFADLATVAGVLHDEVVHPSLEMTVTPGSRQILDAISRTGVYRDLVAAGARVLEPVCGPCIGVGQAPSARLPSVRTFNRNFPGRSGTTDDEVYLCSPATAAVTALLGVIADPRELGTPPAVPDAPTAPWIDDRQIIAPLAPDAAWAVEVVRGEGIVDPPEGAPLPDAIDGHVLIVLGDDVSTGDMAPDGALGMSVWSDIPTCATYLFSRQDPDFHDRAVELGGGLVVGGHNYGQGSSREHAALAPLHLGVRAVIAASFARIHRSNLIAQGILPLLLADDGDLATIVCGDRWSIADVRETVGRGGSSLVATVAGGGTVALEVDLRPGEREVLLAGGLRPHLRDRAASTPRG